MILNTLVHALCAIASVLALPACSSDPIDVEAPPIEWNRVPLGDGSLNVALVRPLGEGNGDRHPVIFALPWGAGSAELVQTFIQSYWITHPTLRGYYVVAPEVRGSTLVDTADEVIPAIFEWMDDELYFDPDKVALVGASNGGRGLFFAATSQPDRFRALVAMPGSYAGDAENLAVLRGKPIWFLVGELDTRWVESTQATIQALDSQGIPAALDIVPGEGHVMRLNESALLDWIDEALGG